MTKYVTINTKIKKIVRRGAPGPSGVFDPSVPIPYIILDPTAGEPAVPLQGMAWWNASEETWDLKQDGATLQVGQEVQWPVTNKTGSIIPNGTVVMAAGTVGATGRILVTPADGVTPANAKYILGIATHDIANNGNGKVTAFGKVRDLNTTGIPEGETWADEDILYVSDSVIGELTNIKPARTKLCMPVAFVINSNANVGVLSIRVTPIDENLAPTPDQRDALDQSNAPSASNAIATIADAIDTDALLYMMRVIADGGTVGDVAFLDSFFKDAKYNPLSPYYDDLVFARSPSWGIKVETGAVKLYSLTGAAFDTTQPLPGLQPLVQVADLNGKDRLLFDGVDDFIGNSSIIWPAGPRTIALMGFSQHTWTNNDIIFAANSGTALKQKGLTPGLRLLSNDNDVLMTEVNAVLDGDYHVSSLFNAADSNIKVDDNVETTGSIGLVESTGYALGASTSGGDPANFSVGAEVALISADDVDYPLKMQALKEFSASEYSTN